jgi:pyridoxamine 5'-phosphate oxidase
MNSALYREAPMELFKAWYKSELAISNAEIPSACCLSTIGTDGYPNARFVSLKKVIKDQFIITGTITSRKGIEINEVNKVALTFWWTGTQRQVRIQGTASKLPPDLVNEFFSERDRSSQIVSIISDQGKEIEDIEYLKNSYKIFTTANPDGQLNRPENFGGYYIKPVRIEFMEFQTTRLHRRKIYEINENSWTVKQLQP